MSHFKCTIVLLMLLSVSLVLSKKRGSEKTQSPKLTRAEEEIDESLADWCRNGFTTKTTEECICATHNGFFCDGEECQSGYGMSFFAKSCERCACKPSDQWGERRGAIQANRKKGKKGKKRKSKKAGGIDD